MQVATEVQAEPADCHPIPPHCPHRGISAAAASAGARAMRPSLRAAMVDRGVGPEEKVARRMVDKPTRKTPEEPSRYTLLHMHHRSGPEHRYGTPLFAKTRWCKMIGGVTRRQGSGWTIRPFGNAGTRREQLRSTADWPARNPYPNSRR